jgi:hypothetical protein
LGSDISKVYKEEYDSGNYAINFPFTEFIKKVQSERRLYPKKSIYNLFWKLVGNGTYGLTLKGLKHSSKFDSRSGGSRLMVGGAHSNPIVGGWITSYIRCVLGELLHYNDK